MPGPVASTDTPSILSLPPEIINKISSLGSAATALALSRAIPDLIPHFESTIWTGILLTPPLYFGEYPLIRSEGSDEDEWAREMAKEGEMRNRARLAERAKAILLRGNEARWRYVRWMRIASRPVAVHCIAAVLDFAAPTLRLLELHGPPKHVFQDDWRPAKPDTLEYSIAMRNILFPSLVALRISLGALRYPALIIALAQSAPNLTVLDVDLECLHDCDPTNDSRGALSFRSLKPSVLPLTSLRMIRFICAPACEHGREQAQVLLHLIKSSAKLTQLVIAYDAADEVLTDNLLEALSDLADLRELEWKGPLGDLREMLEGFASLKRLLVQFSGLQDIFTRLPSLNQLQSLHLRGVPYGLAENVATAGPRDRHAASPYEFQNMTPSFAAGLRQCPQLQAIHFTATTVPEPAIGVIESRVPTCTIRSMRHGDEELLHARLCMPYRTITDIELHGGADIDIDPDAVLISYRRGARTHIKILASLPRSVWHDYTDSDGQDVPLPIIDDMAKAAGLPVNWMGRSVEVGDAAWKVLEDWKAQRPANLLDHGNVARRRG